MSFALHRPTSLADALALAARHGAAARFLAGGTDLVIQIRRGRLAPAHVIDLSAVPGLAGIAGTPEGGLRIGALTTLKAIERHPAFAGGARRALAEAARVVGGHQVRNVGTLGGNVVNASPAADTLPALLALDAEAELVGPGGTRRVPLDAFLLGPGRTDRAPEEVLTAIRLPPPSAASASAFLKAGRRKAMEISVVCAAARLDLGADGRCVAARLALGAVAPTTLRVRAAEALLEGHVPDAGRLAAAAAAAAAATRPLDDVRASARFRRHLAGVLAGRALAACLGRMGNGDAA
jgi:carbon-monoxide dehydrogenase medium subunit